MPSISVPGAIIASSAIGAGTSIIGGAMAGGKAGQAAGTSKEMYQQTRADLAPYNQAGQQVLPDLLRVAQSGPTGGGPDYVSQAAKIRPDSVFTQADLEATPGYQLTLGQGLKSVQSARAARGLGVSGASLKGAAAFATGLADATYSNRFSEAQTAFSDVLGLNTAQQGNLMNEFSRLSDTAKIGANAAAQTGQTGATLAGQQSNALMAQGADQAAALKGIGNAVTGGVNSYLSYNALQDYMKTGGRTGGYEDATPVPITG